MMFGAMAIHVVAAGTQIDDPRGGPGQVVDDQTIVHRLGDIYVTERVFSALKSRIDGAQRPTCAPDMPDNAGQ